MRRRTTRSTMAMGSDRGSGVAMTNPRAWLRRCPVAGIDITSTSPDRGRRISSAILTTATAMKTGRWSSSMIGAASRFPKMSSTVGLIWPAVSWPGLLRSMTPRSENSERRSPKPTGRRAAVRSTPSVLSGKLISKQTGNGKLTMPLTSRRSRLNGTPSSIGAKPKPRVSPNRSTTPSLPLRNGGPLNNLNTAPQPRAHCPSPKTRVAAPSVPDLDRSHNLSRQRRPRRDHRRRPQVRPSNPQGRHRRPPGRPANLHMNNGRR